MNVPPITDLDLEGRSEKLTGVKRCGQPSQYPKSAKSSWRHSLERFASEHTSRDQYLPAFRDADYAEGTRTTLPACPPAPLEKLMCTSGTQPTVRAPRPLAKSYRRFEM
jgi:hypothetical protein